MEDLELVLRFFALLHYQDMDMNYKDYLSDFMDSRNARYQEKPDLRAQDQELFTRAVTNSWEIFGPRAFRKPGQDGKESKKSAPLANAVRIIVPDANPKLVRMHVAQIRKAFTSM